MTAGGGWVGRTVGRGIHNIPTSLESYRRGLEADFLKGKTASGFMGGVGRIAERKGLMIGLGGAVGVAIGANLDQNDPGHGAKVGAIIGAGGGLVLATGLRASRVWSGFGRVGRVGLIGALSAAAFGTAALMSRSRYAQIDEAIPEDNGLRGRMNTIGAEGDLVFGLHRSR
jgi:hypothetical protein